MIKLTSKAEFINFATNNLTLHCQHWYINCDENYDKNDNEIITIFLLHGWMDCSASWQLVIDYLQQNNSNKNNKKYHFIAFDWRGFGLSKWFNTTYAFVDNLADLDAIVHYFFPQYNTQKINIVGHSMGGFIATLYAGLRPQKVGKFITLEGFGLAPSSPEVLPTNFERWLSIKNYGNEVSPKFHQHNSKADFMQWLIHKNSRLTLERAEFLTEHLAIKNDNNKYVFNADAFHKNAIPPTRFHLEDAKVLWKKVEAEVLWVLAKNSWVYDDFFHCRENGKEDYKNRMQHFKKINEILVENSSHMLHYDQPEKIAELIQNFF